MEKNMIFHFPLKLDTQARSASGIRPQRMLAAFKDIGYNVIEISGYSRERKKIINKLKKEIDTGLQIDFLYSESSTMPTLLTDPSHIPVRPFVDFSFFKYCANRKIPVGLFYRDMYWKFPEYVTSGGKVKSFIAKAFYKYDILKYKQLLSKLYLPSLKMGEYFREFANMCYDELPPACGVHEIDATIDCQNKNNINLLYVGGIGKGYKLHTLVNAIKGNSSFTLTICTRKEEWDLFHAEYEDTEFNKNIHVVHLSGEALEKIYMNADIAVLFLEPSEFRIFANPYKLFEYIGYGKPVLASKDTYAGEYVKRLDIGWTIPYDTKAAFEFLEYIKNNTGDIKTKTEQVKKLAALSRWTDRARKVMSDLIDTEGVL
jgi:glycosyltransferase involved in cell wall biosynthesis